MYWNVYVDGACHRRAACLRADKCWPYANMHESCVHGPVNGNEANAADRGPLPNVGIEHFVV